MTIIYRGLTLGTGTVYAITGISGFGSPEVRVSVYHKPGEHGGEMPNVFWGTRLFAIEGVIHGTDLNDYLSKREAFFNAFDIADVLDDFDFTLGNKNFRIKDAKVSSTIITPFRSGEVTRGSYRVDLQAPEHNIYSQTLHSYNIYLPTGGGGTAISTSVPATLAPDISGMITANNIGNSYVYPTATIYGPVTNPSLSNPTVGKALTIELTLGSDDYLEIDFKTRTVKLNGVTSRRGDVIGDFWYLQPGENKVYYTAGSYNANSYTVFKFRDGWIGI